MNAYPLQNPFGGPNYFTLSDGHFFEINIDNNGDSVADMTFQFFHGNRLGGTGVTEITDPDEDDCTPTPYSRVVHQGITLPIGTGANLKNIAVPLKFVGPITAASQGAANWFEYYQMNFVTPGGFTEAVKTGSSEETFEKPFDYAGEKTFGTAAQYEAYARTFIHSVNIPGCGNGRVFVGQRKESFYLPLGQIFDLLNINPLTTEQCEVRDNVMRNLNIDTFALEVPNSCLLQGAPAGNTVIGAWLTVRKLDHDGDDNHVAGRQVSRLGNPLINELVIGLLDKRIYNQDVPTRDGVNFLNYVTHPTLPAIIDLLFRSAVGSTTNIAPSNIPRNDLVTTFLTGLPGVNKPNVANQVPSDMLRLNLATPITSKASQNALGVIAGDNAGFPNGRRPGDDVVDIAMRVMMGKLCHLNLGLCNPADAPVGNAPLTDGVPQLPSQFDDFFPYLRTPNPGARNTPTVSVCALCEPCDECNPDPAPPARECAGVQVQAVFSLVLLFLAMLALF
jgi:hypothetical protein